MKRFSVVFEESAQADVRATYEWGCRKFGKKEAQKWVKELRNAVRTQLGTVPFALPLAPESEAFHKEIRQMIIGRYRVLFTIDGRKVHVLHIRGAFAGPGS
jgi:plasmid stabilization system protein ParE